MREYIYSIMTDEKPGFKAVIARALLSAVSFFYGFIVRAVRFINIYTAKALPCKVISIGNITLGGTGKTPAACMLAKMLRTEGRRPAVLIRGYGNDEWKMLKSFLGYIPLIVGRDRLASGKKACKSFNADTVILDDGFQHWRLKRDLDMVLIDSTNPFGNRRLFPRGVLREDIGSIKRADIVMLTKTDMGRENIKKIKNELKEINPAAPVLESMHKPITFYDFRNKDALDLLWIKGRHICALSSIVNTRYFEYILRSLGADIAKSFHYPDHYEYKKSDLHSVLDGCKSSGIDTVVTTQKDAVKLNELDAADHALRTRHTEVHILILHVELKVTYAEEALKERLHGLYSS